MRRKIYLLPHRFSTSVTEQRFSNHKHSEHEQYDRSVVSDVNNDKWINTHLRNS